MKPGMRLRFGWLRAVMADERLKPRAKLVAWAVEESANSETLECRVSHGYLAKRIGMTERTVWTGIRELMAADWIIAQKLGGGRAGKTGAGLANCYQLHFDKVESPFQVEALKVERNDVLPGKNPPSTRNTLSDNLLSNLLQEPPSGEGFDFLEGRKKEAFQDDSHRQQAHLECLKRHVAAKIGWNRTYELIIPAMNDAEKIEILRRECVLEGIVPFDDFPDRVPAENEVAA